MIWEMWVLPQPPCRTLGKLLSATFCEAAVDLGFTEMVKHHLPQVLQLSTVLLLSHARESRHLKLVVLLKMLTVISLGICPVFMEDNDISQTQTKG